LVGLVNGAFAVDFLIADCPLSVVKEIARENGQ
jgi:hypothetical protein